MLHERKAVPKGDICVIYRAFLKRQTLENRSVVSRGRQGGGKRVATGHTRGQQCSYSALLNTVVVTWTDLVQNTNTHKWRWNWVRSEWAQCIVLTEKQGLFNKEKNQWIQLRRPKKKRKRHGHLKMCQKIFDNPNICSQLKLSSKRNKREVCQADKRPL